MILAQQAALPTWAALAIAAMPVLGAITVAWIGLDNRRTRRENTDQHTAGRKTLEEVVGTLNVVHGDVIAIRDDVGELAGDHEVTKHRVADLEQQARRRRS